MKTNRIAIKTHLLIGIISCTLVACQSGSEEKGSENEKIDTDVINNPEGEDTDKQKFGEFDFEKQSHDFGKVKEGKKVAHTFHFTNSGEAPLVIDKAEVSCGCTVPNYPRDPIKPGKSGAIDVVFDSDGRPGKFKKSINLMANTGEGPKVLQIKGHVIETQ